MRTTVGSEKMAQSLKAGLYGPLFVWDILGETCRRTHRTSETTAIGIGSSVRYFEVPDRLLTCSPGLFTCFLRFLTALKQSKTW